MTTLYRKYRPSLFSEISGQEHILQTLTNAIKNSNVSHAYLFTGPRGTGKTTTARIFAKTVNCLKPITKTKKSHIGIEPCNKCINCKMILENKAIDLIEIDAASHTGVDNIRQLKEAIDIPPTNFKYKVYIIDEVHMLSMGAFNALLKTLEEPPAHAIFILATTELHKVPATIISRCQQFNVKPLTRNEIVNRLSQIAKKEDIEIDKETLSLIATEAGGGMRDAESLLGQIISMGEKKILPESVQKTLGISPKSTLLKLVTAISDGEMATTVSIINQLQSDGVSMKSFGKQLLNYCRNLMLTKIASESDTKLLKDLTSDELSELKKIAKDFELPHLTILIASLQNSLTQSNQSDIPQLPLEMALIEYFLKIGKVTITPQKKTELTNKTLKKKPSNTLKNTGSKIQPQEQNNLPNQMTKAVKLETESADSLTLTSKSPSKNPVTKSESTNIMPDSNGTENTESDEIATNLTPASESDLSINIFIDKWAEILEGVSESSLSIAGVLKNCAPTAIDGDFVLIKVSHAFGRDRLNNPQSKLTIEKVFANIFKVRLKAKFLTEDELPKDVIVERATDSSEGTSNSESNNDNIDGSQSSESSNELLYEAMKKIGGKIVRG
jgi:DNA polymerase-3 subunit gamma/tau